MRSAHDELLTWLHETVASKSVEHRKDAMFRCTEDLVLRRGQLFRSAPLSNSQLSIVLTAAERAGNSFPVGRCFANAARLVLADRTGRLQYVEGYAMGYMMPVHHAWCHIDGKVIDLTWTRRDEIVAIPHRYAARVLGVYGPSHAYIGMCFSHDDVVRRYHDLTNADPFLEDPSLLEHPALCSRRVPS
jgi:hypothetical protein